MMIEAPFEKFTKLYAKDEVVFKENTPGKDMFIVYSGKINLYKEQQDKRVLLGTLCAGDFFGEMALIDGSSRSATAIAAEDTQLIVLDESKFLFLIRHQPYFALIVMHKLSDTLRQTTKRWASDRQ